MDDLINVDSINTDNIQGCVPVEELEELLKEWEDTDTGPMLWRDIAKRRKTQLEALIEEYQYE